MPADSTAAVNSTGHARNSRPIPASDRISNSLTSELESFDFDPRTRVVFGSGTLNRLGEFTKSLGDRVLVVTDAGLRDAGHVERAKKCLDDAGLAVTFFDEVHPNPTTKDVAAALDVAKQAEINVIVGLGGGSSMDCAKGVNFLLTNGGKMEDYWGVGKATKPMLPMVAVPTTAGTGSEAQSFALIAQAESHMKMACGDKKAACRVAVLDPELTLSMPVKITAATGVDAISHAVETYVTKPRNGVSSLFSRKSWRLLSTGFPRVLHDGQDLEARGAMLLGAHFAGAAIENSMLGATHALANPLTAHYDLAHGVAIGVMLPHVVRFNGVVVGNLYADLAKDAGLDNRNPAESLADFLTEIIASSGQPTDLKACGVSADLIPVMAREAAQQWTGNFNPRPVDATNLEELYRCALAPT
ncbi:iron-containing alcohol dehydrogenase [Thalassoroseus pseudoceratinae]|uniref:iron-containing alcohol dehydrogenase n=1 Tax=Thalassoroseus pseudoceratinae TaxID=2713176 RepID=UPI00141E554C|nr:iron-containing alcohol dehydrogenase [Thalassoroseus pseudoceratinae]